MTCSANCSPRSATPSTSSMSIIVNCPDDADARTTLSRSPHQARDLRASLAAERGCTRSSTPETPSFALGAGTLESTKHLVRDQVGPLGGIAALPELRTLCPRLAQMAEAGNALALQRQLATAMIGADAPGMDIDNPARTTAAPNSAPPSTPSPRRTGPRPPARLPRPQRDREEQPDPHRRTRHRPGSRRREHRRRRARHDPRQTACQPNHQRCTAGDPAHPAPRPEMVLRLLAFNAELWLADHLNTYLRDNDEYRTATRNLFHLGGMIAYTPQAITVTLHRPQTPKLARSLALLIEEINTNPPRMPGDHRPITYTLTTP
jgi:hypothetical protein